MYVDDKKLITLITKATIHCNTCPFYTGGNFSSSCFCENCTEKVLNWIQETERKEILIKPFYDTPCEDTPMLGKESVLCEWCNWQYHCPYV